VFNIKPNKQQAELPERGENGTDKALGRRPERMNMNKEKNYLVL
jgi:hypothetical protein